MNKLLFILERDFTDTITLVANNEMDLIEHLEEEYDFREVELKDGNISLKEVGSSYALHGKLEWIKHI